jgi:hypothetical protein
MALRIFVGLTEFNSLLFIIIITTTTTTTTTSDFGNTDNT